MCFQKPWCIRSWPISTIAKSCQGFDSSRWPARRKRRSVISYTWRSRSSFSSVRKFVQSNRYSPTVASTSSRSAGGNVYRLSIDGVRKQLTITPRSGAGG